MDNFIQEIDEELKRDRQLALWRKYGRHAVAAALLVVIAVAAVVGWRQYQANRRAEAGLAYQQALQATSGRPDEALKAFQSLAEDAPAGYAELARLQYAAVLVRRGDIQGAAAAYDALARDGSAGEPFRNAALILFALATLDRADPAELGPRIEPLTAAASPWRHSALEIKALLARKRGDHAAARDIFTRLADDPETPPGVRARAAEMVAVGGK